MKPDDHGVTEKEEDSNEPTLHGHDCQGRSEKSSVRVPVLPLPLADPKGQTRLHHEVRPLRHHLYLL
jgi:hypothetical protein